MTTKSFHISDLLSISTGALVSHEHIGGVYKILNHLTGDDLMTHQLPLAADATRPDLLQQHPWLRDIKAPEFRDVDHVHAWVDDQAAFHGRWHDVVAVPQSWGVHNPLTDLANMRPDMPVIVIVDGEDGEP